MKILVINGSPKGENSNTMKLTRAFLEGMGENELKILTLSGMNIASCKGCFCCWNKTPGKCVIADDMMGVIEDQLWADIIIWSFPLYFFSVPGPLKNLIDRQLPMSMPFMSDKKGTGSGSHDSRYDMSGKRHILISTCGFYTSEKNYDSVIRMFDHFLGEGCYEKLFCGQGELFRVPELKNRTEQYLQTVKQAGEEYVSGGITGFTRNKLAELLYPRDVFETMADSSWGIEKDTGEAENESLTFTRQMAALYNKNSFDGKIRVVEICYTDLGKTYQIELTSEGSRVITDNSLTATTRIDTPWNVWLSIARGEIRGDAALAQGQYHVSGDFSLMINWDRFFGNGKPDGNLEAKPADSKKTKPSMVTMLVAWIVFWCAVSVDPIKGGIIAAVCSAVIPIVMHNRMIIYDCISCGAVQLLSLLAILTGTYELPVVLGYGIFGLMWLLSCLTKEPLCAAYVKYNYGGEDALENPMFMKTNRILAVGWGALYVLIALWSWPLLITGHVVLLQIINNSATVLMGIFTTWFEHWYPAKMAKG